MSAFNSFCAGVADGRFPQLADREDLWRILMTITVRKAYAQVQRQKRLKRGGGRVVEEAALRGQEGASPSDPASAAGLDMIAGDDPTPEFAAIVAEEYRLLLDSLEDDGLRQVAISRMEGYTCDEIAAQLGCARRTVARRLDLIRKTWLAARRGGLMTADPREGSDLDSPLARARRIHLACERFEAEWRKGIQPRLELFLEEFCPDDRAALFGELLPLEIELRRDRGDHPCPAEYQARFPALCDLIEENFRDSVPAGTDPHATAAWDSAMMGSHASGERARAPGAAGRRACG